MAEYCLPFRHDCDKNIMVQHQIVGKQLQFVMSCSLLDPTAKLLWIWMVHHSAFDGNHCCWFSYYQFSQALHCDVQKVHAALESLYTMGFLKTNLLNALTITLRESVQQRSFMPVLPKYAWLDFDHRAETLFSEELIFKDENGKYKRPRAFIEVMEKAKRPLPCLMEDNPLYY